MGSSLDEYMQVRMVNTLPDQTIHLDITSFSLCYSSSGLHQQKIRKSKTIYDVLLSGIPAGLYECHTLKAHIIKYSMFLGLGSNKTFFKKVDLMLYIQYATVT